MSFLQREINLIQKALGEPHTEKNRFQLYAAQQALSWALDPEMYASPYAFILDIPADSEGYSVRSRPAQSLDTCVDYAQQQ